MGLPVRRIWLRRGERRRLERLVNKRTTPQRVVERANIVLCSAEGRSGSAICREVWAYRGRRSRSGSTGTRQVALKSCSRTDHARVDHARSLRTTKRRSSARPSRRSLQTPRTGVAVSWPRKWASIRPPSRGSGGLMDYSPTASSTSSCPLILTSLKSCAGPPLHNPSSPRSAKRKRLWLHSTSNGVGGCGFSQTLHCPRGVAPGPMIPGGKAVSAAEERGVSTDRSGLRVSTLAG